MMRSMYSGVSGMKNFQTAMDTIGNNIANVNTIGFKSSTVIFKDILNQTLQGASAPTTARGGTNPKQVGLGASVASIGVMQTQGNLQTTGKVTDLALQGDGFFVVNDGASRYYTRAGNFDVDSLGNLVNSANGYKVQGWIADIAGNLNTNTPVSSIKLPMGRTIAPIATTKIQYQDNLNTFTNGRLNYGGTTTTNGIVESSLLLTDVDGTQISVNLDLTPVKDAYNTFRYSISPNQNAGIITSGATASNVAEGIIVLDQYGVVQRVTPDGGGPDEIAITPNNGHPVMLQLPQVGQRDGGFFNINPTGTPQTLPLETGAPPAFAGAGDYGPMPVYDRAGNEAQVTYHVINVGGNTYNWTAEVVSGGTIQTGGTGTFDWTPATSVTNASSGVTIIETTAGNSIHIQPPINGIAPVFSVVENAPEAQNVPITAGPHTVTFHDATGAAGDVNVTYTLTAPTAPSTTWTYVATVAAADGTIIGTTGVNGQFDWDGANITNSNSSSLTIQTTAGLELTIAPPLDGPAAANAVFHAEPAEPVIATFASPPDTKTSTKVYDSLGVPHTITTTIRRVGTNRWDWTAVEDSGLLVTNGRGTLTFDTKTGFVTNSPGGPMTFNPVGADPVRITPDFSSVTQGYTEDVTNDSYQWPLSTFAGPTQDGYPLGVLTGYNIDNIGRIVGIFSNGMNQNLGQVAVAKFTNPGGLSRNGDTLFQETSNSGTAQIGQAGMGGRGTVAAGTEEMSNVDLSKEFTEMIITERGFQANSKIITTSDEMLQTLVNLKQ